jgi:hypothetical protein
VSRSWTKLIFPVSLAVFAVVWCARSGNPPPSGVGAPTIAAPGSYALLDGLAPGSDVGEWKVTRIVVNESVEKKPQLAIELERKGSGITVWVGRKENVKNPPVVTDKYALTFGHARPYGEPIPEGAAESTMQKIAERVRRTEATAEVPAGL